MSEKWFSRKTINIRQKIRHLCSVLKMVVGLTSVPHCDYNFAGISIKMEQEMLKILALHCCICFNLVNRDGNLNDLVTNTVTVYDIE